MCIYLYQYDHKCMSALGGAKGPFGGCAHNTNHRLYNNTNRLYTTNTKISIQTIGTIITINIFCILQRIGFVIQRICPKSKSQVGTSNSEWPHEDTQAHSTFTRSYQNFQTRLHHRNRVLNEITERYARSLQADSPLSSPHVPLHLWPCLYIHIHTYIWR